MAGVIKPVALYASDLKAELDKYAAEAFGRTLFMLEKDFARATRQADEVHPKPGPRYWDKPYPRREEKPWTGEERKR